MSHTHTALVSRGGQLVKESLEIPTPGEHQLLVKVQFVAQNPTDVQSFDGNAFGDGAVLGCDYVGVVEQAGSGVSKIKPGTTIAGLIWGGEVKGLGGFSEYTIADERICFPVPSAVTPDQASTVPLASCTALLALFSANSLNMRQGSGETVLVWGGSSSVGSYAIQIAKHYGLNVITTCSPRHHDRARAMGASAVFDYKDDEVLTKIRESASTGLRCVFDTIGNDKSSSTASRAITEQDGVLCTVRPGKTFTENVADGVKVTDVLVWTAFLKDHSYGEFHWPKDQRDHDLAAKYFEQLPRLLSEKILTPNRPEVLHGLNDVPNGFQKYRDGVISGYKIVFEL